MKVMIEIPEHWITESADALNLQKCNGNNGMAWLRKEAKGLAQELINNFEQAGERASIVLTNEYLLKYSKNRAVMPEHEFQVWCQEESAKLLNEPDYWA